MLSNLLNIPAALIRLVNIKKIGRFALYCFNMATRGRRGDAADGETQGRLGRSGRGQLRYGGRVKAQATSEEQPVLTRNIHVPSYSSCIAMGNSSRLKLSPLLLTNSFAGLAQGKTESSVWPPPVKAVPCWDSGTLSELKVLIPHWEFCHQ